jgi:hypothetical protein
MERRQESELLENIRARRAELAKLLEDSSGHWGYEDPIYRYYHHSFKVFALQASTERIVSVLTQLLPGRRLNARFLEILAAGTGNTFSPAQNVEWAKHARPIIEAFFHARFFLEMAVRYADIPSPPETLPSGWAALLCLYDLR